MSTSLVEFVRGMIGGGDIKIWRRVFLLLSIIAVTMFVVINSELYPLIKTGNIDKITSFLEKNLFYTLFFTFIIMMVQNSFTIIPLILVISINITLFDFIFGFLWSWITSIVSAAFVFIGIRYGFQDLVLKKMKPKMIKKGEDMGFWYILQGRVLPFIPTSIINITAGLSPIRFKHFLLGTVIGNFIYFFILALIPAGLLSGRIDELAIGIIALLCMMILYTFKKQSKKEKQNKELMIKDKH